ncbi:hypothetical protein AVEN_70520-1, partial [Araneus ventricosus]
MLVKRNTEDEVDADTVRSTSWMQPKLYRIPRRTAP